MPDVVDAPHVENKVELFVDKWQLEEVLDPVFVVNLFVPVPLGRYFNRNGRDVDALNAKVVLCRVNKVGSGAAAEVQRLPGFLAFHSLRVSRGFHSASRVHREAHQRGVLCNITSILCNRDSPESLPCHYTFL